MRRYVISMLALMLMALAGCKSDEPPVPQQPARRTIVVYMIATNSLGANGRDRQDLDEMDKAVKEGALNGCRLLVYRVGKDNSMPELLEIKQDKRGNAVHETLVNYDNAQGASVTPERMRQVIDDVKDVAPADEYGLVLWSHGTGWARSITTKSGMGLKDYGEDNGATMTLTELAQGLPTQTFEWIYADVCYMGCVEVAYELRKHCHYFVGYPTEIPAPGMPYDITLPLLCQPTAQLASACRATYNYYNAMTDQNRTFSGVIVDCNSLDELATTCRAIQHSAVTLESLSGMQYYNINSSHFFYDFLQYYRAICPPHMQDQLTTIYNKVVIDKMATATVFNRILIDPSKFSGLSTYIMGTSPGINEQYYHQLAWYKDVID